MGFRTVVVLPARDVSSMVAALDQLSGGPPALPPRIAAGVRAAAGELRSSLPAHGVTDVFECPKERALDIAALLLDAATTLQLEGRHLAAFALEGVEGRLLESLVTATAYASNDRSEG